MICVKLLLPLLALVTTSSLSAAFNSVSFATKQCARKGTTTSLSSWGKRKKEFTEEEFARGGGATRGFDSYELQERSDFMNQVKNDQKNLLKRKDEEFLEIARMAGVSDQSGDGIDPMGEFTPDGYEDDDIDVRVEWDDN